MTSRSGVRLAPQVVHPVVPSIVPSLIHVDYDSESGDLFEDL